MSKLKQLGLLIWKNFKLQRKHPIGTIFQIGLPISVSFILLALRLFLVTAKDCPALVWNEFNVTSPPPVLRRSFSIGLAANNASQLSHELFNNLTFYLNEHAYPDQNITLQIFPNEDDMVNEIMSSSEGNSTKCIGGIYFTRLPSKQANFINYKLRFINPKEDNSGLGKNGHGWLTKYVFPRFQNPEPRNKDDSHGGSPDYYSTAFLFTQHAVDRAIIGQFATQDQTSVRMEKFPFPNYVKDPFILIIQTYIPYVIFIAFSYTTLDIVRSIVYEKEQRLKVSCNLFHLLRSFYFKV